MEPTHKRNEIANAFVGTFAFLPTLDLTQKKQKSLQATAQGQCTRKEPHLLTAVTRDLGFGHQLKLGFVF
jgi:hypothetical protein